MQNNQKKSAGKTTIQIGKGKPQECKIFVTYTISKNELKVSHADLFGA